MHGKRILQVSSPNVSLSSNEQKWPILEQPRSKPLGSGVPLQGAPHTQTLYQGSIDIGLAGVASQEPSFELVSTRSRYSQTNRHSIYHGNDLNPIQYQVSPTHSITYFGTPDFLSL